MSSELSVSETTPLRRPDLSEELSTSTPTRSVNANNIHQTALNTNGTIINKTSNSSSRHNNNNNIEIDSGIHRIDNNCDHNSITMETNKRILCRIGTDLLILMCVGFPILLFFLLGDPYKRGFFCDDESLMHPFHESTVKSWMLYIIGLVIPVGIVIGVELVKANMKPQTTTTRRFVFNGWEVPEWLIECYKKLGVFGFGAAMSQLATDIAKYSIGRLRPHFFAVCQPIMRDGTNCSNPINAGRYIEEFTCLGINSTPRMLKEVRLSFPSGHSSFSTFTMVYMALYLQSRMNWKGSKLLKHFLQFLLIMIAWYTALSRVSDYKHHWSDVLSGMTIGALFAVIVARFTPTNWFNWYTVWPMSEQTTRKLK
ncbi:putative phosphatidate phosphatase isoform X2 [Eupeodes corollae]|uniref:putative phosphatidate phosphatase isoform X2 n=1 Tax=Eupeodes corollae TaxID=290404 RepID=UPI0024919C08|nr:putative phosphatidate phosphatase isoform X2 [Eupeodes corollae]